MNNILQAILLGLVEGLTEFIPISSTGHLILVSDFLGFVSDQSETFQITIQLGAILAVLVLYRDFFRQFLSPKALFAAQAQRIIVAIFPALLMGLLFYETIKSLFSSKLVVINLIIGGVIMIIVEKIIKPTPNTRSVESMTLKQAAIIGLCQCAALIPGMSRSGSTIVGGLVAKLDYETSAKFSFIIAVPVMLLAVGYDLLKTAHLLTLQDLQLILIGFIVSFITALLAIVSFMKILSRFKLFPFALYRVIFGGLLLLVFFL